MRSHVLILVVIALLLIPLSVSALNYGQQEDLSSVDANFWNDNTQERLSEIVCMAGDVDNNGADDFLVAAPVNGTLGSNQGAAWLFLGGKKTYTPGMGMNEADALFLCDEFDGRSPKAMSGVGDINGDGYDDFAFGNMWSSKISNNRGEIYIFFGHNGTWEWGKNFSEADLKIYGEGDGNEFGAALCHAGDMNGDGLDDLVVGGPGGNGWVYTFFGRQSWNLTYKADEADAMYEGTWASSFASDINGIGDVNGDHLDDIIVGSGTYQNSRGRAYLFFGREDGWLTDGKMEDECNAILKGTEVDSKAAITVDGAGDMDGDGFDDFLIGQPYGDFAQENGGMTYLFYGHSGPWEDMNISDANASFSGEEMGDESGGCVRGLGDINGDGYDDIGIGARMNDYTDDDAGQVYVILGSAAKFGAGEDLSICDMSFCGEAMNHEAGGSLDGGGDVNGDGYPDLLIGARRYGGGLNGHGKAYLVYPTTNSLPSLSNVMVVPSKGSTSDIAATEMYTTVWIRAQGTDMDSGMNNVVYANITSSHDPSTTLRIRLYETGKGTGIYLAPLTVEDRTHDGYNWISTIPTSTIEIKVESIGTVTDSFMVNWAKPKITSPERNFTAYEDQPFEFIFESKGGKPTLQWATEMTPDWLTMDQATGRLHGTPNDSDVGNSSFWVHIIDDLSETDSILVFMDVINALPEVVNHYLWNATEDEYYTWDFVSTDDGEDTNITWEVDCDTTSAFSFNISTLEGTPTQLDVGEHFLTINVTDGNGGMGTKVLQLNVTNVDDKPMLVGLDDAQVDEDSELVLSYDVMDEDGSAVTIKINTNASWLMISSNHTYAIGTPTNDDVGTFFYNVSLDDGALYNSYNYTITVLNTNDAPVWDVVPNSTTVIVEAAYNFDVNASDVDPGAVLVYSILSTPTSNIMINGEGKISWTPTETDTYTINMSVSDGVVTIYYDYIIDVIEDVGDLLPYFNSAPLVVATVGTLWQYTPSATDPMGEDITITLESGPTGMVLDGPTLKWTPAGSDVGLNHVVVRATAGTRHMDQEFTINVTLTDGGDGGTGNTTNRAPVINSIDDRRIEEGDILLVQVTASDPDDDDLIYAVDGPDGMEISEAGLISWSTKQEDEGFHTLNVSVSDGELTSYVEFEVEVFFTGDDPGFMNPGNALCFAAIVAVVAVMAVIIIALILIIVIRSKKKKDDDEELPPAKPEDHYPSSDAIEPEVETEDIFKDKDRTVAVAEATKAEPITPEVAPIPENLVTEDDIQKEIEGTEPEERIEDDTVVPEESRIDPSVKPVGMDQLALPPARIMTDDAEEDFGSTIDEILIMSSDGLLLDHFARSSSSEIDRDVLSGMLVAVQSFVSDSFDNMDASLRRLEMKDFTVLIEPGKYISVVGITRDKDNRELNDHLLRMMREMEREMAEVFQGWDGNMETIKEVETYVQKLLEGKYE